MKSFEGRRGETLIVRPGELCGSDASASVDFRLTNLEDCTVLLYVSRQGRRPRRSASHGLPCVFRARLDVTRALHVDKLTRCHVVTGPVAGSVLMDACTDCTFVFASRQIRLHTSHRCDFYLHVLSRPIIEHCDALRFACYNVGYTALAAQLAAAELDKPRAASMWRCVDDFGWHRTQHSPNWSLVPPADYRTVWPDAVAADVVTELGAILSVRGRLRPLFFCSTPGVLGACRCTRFAADHTVVRAHAGARRGDGSWRRRRSWSRRHERRRFHCTSCRLRSRRTNDCGSRQRVGQRCRVVDPLSASVLLAVNGGCSYVQWYTRAPCPSYGVSVAVPGPRMAGQRAA